MDKFQKLQEEERHRKFFKALAKDVARKIMLISVSTPQKLQKEYAYGEPLQEPLLGNHFRIPFGTELRRWHPKPCMNTTLSYIPVYHHVAIYDPVDIIRPQTPELLASKRKSRLSGRETYTTTFSSSSYL